MKKLKLRKQVWFVMVGLIFISLGIYTGIKVYQDYQYKKTNEYKLLQVGYQKEDIKKLEEVLDQSYLDKLMQEEKNEFILSLIQEKYFLKSNLERYIKYHEDNQSFTSTKVVTMVNVNRDYDYYSYDIDVDLSKDYLILTNKYYRLANDYEPEDLVDISNRYYYGSNHKIRKDAYEAFKNMWEDAYKEDIYLIINSSYRNYESQENVYNDYKKQRGEAYADSIAARAGYSEHQTGLSLDIFSKANTLTSNFRGSPAYNWLTSNAYKYGFIERYPEGKEEITGFSAEAWHWRYVGVEVATYIQENNITFDEYYAYFLA